MSKKTVLQIYAAAVCFFSAAAGVISLVGAVHGVLSFSAPEFFMSGEVYGAHQNNRAYVRWLSREERRWSGKPSAPELPEEEEELTALREESFAAKIAEKRHNAARSLVHSLIAVLFCAALFFPHWRLMQRREE